MSKNVLLIILIAIGHYSFAQQTEEAVEDTVNLEELIITGTKLPTSQRETAKQVTVIPKEEIEKSSGKDLSQLLQEQSGIIINGAYGNPGQNKGIYVRGAGTEYTLILIDGQPIYDPSGVGGALDIRLLPLEQFERIEILKGSQSTLYGTDAMAGVINLITNQSEDKRIGIYGGASYGSLNTLKSNLGIRGNLDFLDYNVNFFRNSSEGISEAMDTAGTAEFDKDGYVQNGFQSNLNFHLSDKVKVSPYFRLTNFDGDFDADAFTDGENTYSSKMYQTGGNIDFTDENLSVELSYGYSNTDRSFVTSFGETPYKGRFHNLDLFGRYKFNEHLKLLGGINYQDHKIFDEATQKPDPSIDIISPYLTLLYYRNNINVELGYRFNQHDLFGSKSTYSVTPSYLIGNSIKAFFSYTTGFKTPTLYQLYGAFGANEDLQPLTSKTIEFGLESENETGAIQGGITYFIRKIDDIIIYDYTLGYLNRDQQNDQGIEVSAKWRINPELSIEGFYNYVEGKLTTLDNNGDEAEIDNLIRRPKHRFSISAQYHIQDKFTVSINGQYMGDRFDYYFNPNNFYAQEEVDLDPYFLVNAYLEYQLFNKKLTLFADLKNITDSAFTEVYGYNTTGFNVQSGIRFQF